nr:transferrin-binding protein-like solute binding protein [Haemophilus parahaemolyticus]
MDGYITNGETSYTASATNKSTGDIAEFMVNFDNKTLTGELKKAGSLNTVFDINGKLDGNSFSGTASTKGDGFALDAKNTLDSTKVRIKTEVKGHFMEQKGLN